MRAIRTSYLARAVVVAVSLLLLTGTSGFAQSSDEKMTIQAVAMGSGTQLGRVFNINIHINEASTPEEQQALVQAFQGEGMKGLLSTLRKMSSKGRISMPATTGFDLNYVRIITGDDGSKMIRMITDRPIAIGEVRGNNRSMDYSLSAFEIKFPAGKNKGTGVLFPACEFSVKDQQLTIEALQNPWNLKEVVMR